MKYDEIVISFIEGGFIDLENMSYIPPRWSRMKTSDRYYDYDDIEGDIIRYLKTPVLRSTGIASYAAIKCGMTRKELVELGMTKSEYWDVFYQNKTEYTIGQPDEWQIVQNIDKSVENTRLYVHTLNYVRRQVIEQWLSRFEIYID